jgi:hypothetical protein
VCNGKTKGLALLSQKQYTFENCTVLHKEAKNNTLTTDTYNRLRRRSSACRRGKRKQTKAQE